MAFSLIANTLSAGGADSTTTSAIDTTGATLLSVFVRDYAPNAASVVTDSKSNTWTQRGGSVTVGNTRVRWFDCLSGTVGSGHTFTATGTSSFVKITVSAWSETSPAFDQVATATEATLTQVTVGPLTPPVNDCLFLTGWGTQQGVEASLSINQSFTIMAGVGNDTAHGYFIQTTAAAKDPTWDGTDFSEYAAMLVTYKAGGGGGGRIWKLAGYGGGLVGEARGLVG